jgi:hypothetical protein
MSEQHHAPVDFAPGPARHHWHAPCSVPRADRDGTLTMILHLSPDSPWAGVAKFALVAHIAGASLGLLSGAAAMSFRKGGRLHRAAGNVFFVSMLTMSAIAAVVAPLLPDRVSAIAGILTFYLVATGWVTARRKERTVGLFDYGAFLVALGVVAADVTFYVWAVNSPTGKLDGAPPQSFYVIGALAALAAGLDLRMIVRGGVVGAQRVARHLWRMSAALFIAVTSFFLGQQQVFPASMRGSPVLFVPVLAVLGAMIFWLIRVRLTRWLERDAVAAKT